MTIYIQYKSTDKISHYFYLQTMYSKLLHRHYTFIKPIENTHTQQLYQF